ncbi:hypothetical protein CMT68_16575 [Elizabethkingia anophelis]|nr:hypothetical protein [Elizabethkingia anophelis]
MKEDNATHPMTVDLVGTMHVALGFAKKLQKWNIYLNVLSFRKGCQGILFFYLYSSASLVFIQTLIKIRFFQVK